MTNKELQNELAKYPDDMPVKLDIKNEAKESGIIDFTEENIMLNSESSYIDENAPEDEWDCEDGKFELGDGKRYLLINPVIY